MLWQKIYWVITAAVLGGAVAFLVSYFMMTPIYSATASLYVYNGEKISDRVSQSDLVASQQLVETYIVILKSDSVLEEVSRRTGDEFTAEEIRDMLSASSTNGTEAFTITVRNKNPETAQRLVNTVIEVLPGEIIRVVKAGAVEIIDRAKVPEDPSSPNIPLNTAVGILLSFVLCVAIIIARSMFDTTVHSEDDLSEFNIPILGVIPALDMETPDNYS
ncbi:MAG: hypothetical protein IKU84_07580 [Clostridia bacterium]|nr:hypothetical protein [Clostridia bacterium]